jgi:shikimate kinase
MEPTDAAELISEIREERASHEAEDKFRERAAMLIAILAMLLAVGSLGGGNVAEDMIHNNIKASDTWAFFQAKNVRQTQYRLAADELEVQLANPGLSPEVRAALQKKVDAYRATVTRYDDEPDPAAPADSLRGEGKKQLSAQARRYESLRERAGAQDSNFDYSEVAFQLAIVLGSVAILALSRKVLYISIGLGVIGALLMLNGFMLMFPLPF